CSRRRDSYTRGATAGTSSTTLTQRPCASSQSAGPSRNEREPMRIQLMSVLVDDQRKALRFYTDVLGFVKKNDIPMGEHSWLTVVSPEDRSEEHTSELQSLA